NTTSRERRVARSGVSPPRLRRDAGRAEAADRDHRRLPRAPLHPGGARARAAEPVRGGPRAYQGLAAPRDQGRRWRADRRRDLPRERADGPEAPRPRLQLPLRLASRARERRAEDPASRPGLARPARAGAGGAGAARGDQHGSDRLPGRTLLSGLGRPLHPRDPRPGVPRLAIGGGLDGPLRGLPPGIVARAKPALEPRVGRRATSQLRGKAGGGWLDHAACSRTTPCGWPESPDLRSARRTVLR